ncbi:molybdenum cofactor guanylyltransferase [Phytoactinopolyspora limicola]|uniref:molybdenum cofactor guanylyltransferase n=1 Tax=Phytoactinopolyspora limicola TaxID=2715536 RepID=UPI001407B158|nr:molybdenum cofactor guanylyltransferase [Phytoactinopolyspora limicola]
MARGAVILAGGSARRLGGADKPQLIVGGRALLDTAIAACTSCPDIVVVGPLRPTCRPVRWTVEEPPGSGPLAALDAGVAVLPSAATTVTVLAADLPAVTASTVERLHEELDAGTADAVLLTDGTGRRQPLTAVYARPALEAALRAAGHLPDRPLRHLVDHLTIATLPDPIAAEDIDTEVDLARWTGTTPTAQPPGRPDDDAVRKDHQAP